MRTVPLRVFMTRFLHIYLSCLICAEWYSRTCESTQFLPFPEVFMHRRSERKGPSVSKFKGRVGKTDRLNVQANRRGGIRL